MLDMSLMAKFIVQGRDAERVLNRVCANDVAVPGRADRLHPVARRAGRDRRRPDRHPARRGAVPAGGHRHRPPPDGALDRAPRAGRRPRGGHRRHLRDHPASRSRARARASCSSRLTSADLSNEAFPYLTAREIDLDYARVLALRVTYVGELGWELHVPAELALTVYDALEAGGSDLGYRNVGLGALSSLRLEKAYRDLGVDIDNTDTPLDAGLGFAVAWDKPGGFVGRDALLAQREVRPPKRRLIQVLLLDPEPILHGGEPILRDGRWIGYVRAGAYGHTLGGGVGLGMIEDEAGIPAEAVDVGPVRDRGRGGPVPGPRFAPAALRPGPAPDQGLTAGPGDRTAAAPDFVTASAHRLHIRRRPWRRRNARPARQRIDR